jgi:3'(2'), 5'-bisphosphate nucleotidase
LSPSVEILPDQAADFIDDLTAIVARASAVIRAISPASAGSALKDDQSPVTLADTASEAAILDGLRRILPGVPVVSEEMSGREAPPALNGSFVLVDPLDGTREFIAGRDDFTVNVAIVTRGTPIAGIVAAPNRHQLWRGIVGGQAERLRMLPDGADQAEPIRARRWPEQGGVATVSRSHLDPDTEQFLAGLGPVTRNSAGSAIKFCRIAEGAADIYPRLATTCEWDVAAGHALVVAAGGIVTTPAGGPLTFGQAAKNFRVPAFIAWGDPVKAASVGE